MRKAAFVLLCISLAGLAPLLGQETTAAPPPAAEQTVAPPSGFSYSPEGRRDPFKDLLAGRDLREKTAIGENQIFIDDLILFGIVKNKNVYTAMIGIPHVRQGRRQVRGRVRPVDRRDAGGPAEDPREGDPPHKAERHHQRNHGGAVT